jgi:protein phosphatase
LRIKSASFSKNSPKKSSNEDRLCEGIQIKNSGTYGYCVADGIGGELGGGAAAQIATETFSEKLSLSGITDFVDIFSEISARIRTYTNDRAELKNMATTLSACIIEADKVLIGHVGDSRIYHLRKEGIMKRTVDQTELQELIEQGVISGARAKSYPRKNVLTSALSAKNDHKLFTSQHSILEGDRFVLTTDGLHNKIHLREISELSMRSRTIEELAGSLLTLIEQRDPTDDYSAICIQV